ncbi:MAG TPA: hypothetical protein VMY35_08920, partial [Phycisphaerae bacterium]|nr:hypothetical protein [Phycisphaerae bacterium]
MNVNRTPVTQEQRFARADQQAEELRAERDLRAQQGQEQAGLSRQFRGRQAEMGIAAARDSQATAAINRELAMRSAKGMTTSAEEIAQIRQAYGAGAAGPVAPKEKLISVRGKMVPAAEAQKLFVAANRRSDEVNRRLARSGHTGAPMVPVSNYGRQAEEFARRLEVTDLPADSRLDSQAQRDVRLFGIRSMQQRRETGVQEGLQREIDDLLNTANQLEATQPQQPQAPTAAPAAPELPAQQLPVTPQDQARDAEIARLKAQLATLAPAVQPAAAPASQAAPPAAPIQAPAAAPEVAPVPPGAGELPPPLTEPLPPVQPPRSVRAASLTAEPTRSPADSQRLTSEALRQIGQDVQGREAQIARMREQGAPETTLPPVGSFKPEGQYEAPPPVEFPAARPTRGGG